MARGLRLWGGLILAWLALPAGAARPADAGPPPAVDLRAEAAQAVRNGGPLVVLFSRRDCAYCETVRSHYLLPLAADPRFRGRILVRQVDQDSPAALTGFGGETTTHGAFADREKIRLVPVVAFYGSGGRRLAEPIAGTRLADFYQAYLEGAVESAMRQLRTP